MLLLRKLEMPLFRHEVIQVGKTGQAAEICADGRMKQDRTTCSNSQYLLCRAARVPVLIDNAAAAEQTAGRVQSLYVLKRYM